MKQKHGDRLAIVTVALESDSVHMRKIAGEVGPQIQWALGTPELARAFGDASAVPTLLLFDGGGKLGGAFYGAPPTLHAEAETRLASILGRR